MLIWIPALWIVFDVLICLRTGYMTQPFPRWEWWTWLICGILLALFAVGAEWLNRRKQNRERIEDKEDIVRQIDAKLEEKVLVLKGDIAAVSQKPEPAERKFQEINQLIDAWRLTTPQALAYAQQQARALQLKGHRMRMISRAFGAGGKQTPPEDAPKK